MTQKISLFFQKNSFFPDTIIPAYSCNPEDPLISATMHYQPRCHTGTGPGSAPGPDIPTVFLFELIYLASTDTSSETVSDS